MITDEQKNELYRKISTNLNLYLYEQYNERTRYMIEESTNQILADYIDGNLIFEPKIDINYDIDTNILIMVLTYYDGITSKTVEFTLGSKFDNDPPREK